MPTNQPSSAPQADAPQPTDDLTAAAVLHDDALDRQPGGGGLGAPNAPIGGDAAGRTGATTPNSPIDAPAPHDVGNAQIEAEARAGSVGGDAPEPGHTSQ